MTGASPTARARAVQQAEGTSGGTVLVVCTANVSRSPLAAHLLGAALSGRADLQPVRVLSAGTDATPGQPIDERVRRELLARGIDPGPFVSTAVDPTTLAQVDLVLAATRAHRSRLVGLAPRLLRRAFTLRQAARIVTSDPHGVRGVSSVAELADVLAALRGQQGPSVGEADDIEDPWGRDDRTYARVIGQVADAVHTLAGAWGPRSP